jgi:hypothetical protein
MKSLDSYSETLPALRKRRDELNADILKRKNACATIRARLQIGGLPSAGNDHENRVAMLLNRSPVEVVPSDTEQLQTLLVEISALQNAGSAIDAAIQTEKRLASNKMLEAVRPEVVRLGSNFGKAFLALRAAHVEYVKFVDEVDYAGANVESLRLYPNGLSDPLDNSGNYAYATREFAERGFLPKSQAPKMI